MTYTCLHTHTDFCDGKDDVESMCGAAFEKGLASIGFSSHAPVDHAVGKTSWHLPQKRLDEYLDTVRSAKQRWAGKIDVYLGLEVDYIKGRMGPADRVYREIGLDYVIGAVHYIFPPDNGEPSIVDAPAGEFGRKLLGRFGGDGEALAAAYWEAETEMIRSGGFDILGHLDLIKKNNSGDKWFSTAAPAYLEKSAALVPLIVEAGCVAEVNTGGMNRGILGEPYPSPRLLSLLCRAGVPAIITADAHKTAHLGGHYGEAKEALLKAGYSRAAVFKGRRSGEPCWESEEIR
ncbi:MAG: histidinol-phosphatase [Spirochaetaceae bacterium]|jgi:histidinol-phosphatase (PHP family)|nr:histidinol-phosphatase [Spirochaetaceae bacterium]